MSKARNTMVLPGADTADAPNDNGAFAEVIVGALKDKFVPLGVPNNELAFGVDTEGEPNKFCACVVKGLEAGAPKFKLVGFNVG